MTRQEVRDEAREQDGNAEMKGRVRRVQREMARRRMIADVARATVVITNPTHFAVALEYRRETMAAPRVVAKGRDLIARKIREVARKHEVPIVENKPLAQALFKSAEVGDTIPGAPLRRRGRSAGLPDPPQAADASDMAVSPRSVASQPSARAGRRAGGRAADDRAAAADPARPAAVDRHRPGGGAAADGHLRAAAGRVLGLPVAAAPADADPAVAERRLDAADPAARRRTASTRPGT